MQGSAQRIRGISPPGNYSSAAAEKSKVVATRQGSLYSVTAFNNDTVTNFLQIFDAAALPADGAVPMALCSVLAGYATGLDWGTLGKKITNGIVICLSSTAATKTLVAGDVALFEVRYE